MSIGPFWEIMHYRVKKQLLTGSQISATLCAWLSAILLKQQVAGFGSAACYFIKIVLNHAGIPVSFQISWYFD